MNDTIRILVVDDDPHIRFATGRILKKAGYDTLEASTGEEGLRLTREHRPGIVLLDVVLPDIDGLDVCRRIKTDPHLKGCYVILLSGQKILPDEQADGLEAGADGYIVRPVPNRELLARVRAMVRVKRAEDALREYANHLEHTVAERTRELREAQEQLVRREKLSVLGQMAGSVGHELRSPLATISNAIYYLSMILPDAESEVAEYLEIITGETRKAEKIINDLLNFSRLKSPGLQNIQVEDVISLILEQQAPPEHVRLKTAISNSLPGVLVDPVHLEQILNNLVTNAYQAMPQGGTLSIRVSLEGGKGVVIRVNDTGEGIAPELLDKLFEPLFTTKAKGIGLGLAVSKHLVEANGGSISVESELGKGSVFLVRLPTE